MGKTRARTHYARTHTSTQAHVHVRAHGHAHAYAHAHTLTHTHTHDCRYNLKRKVLNMPPVTAENFQERLVTQQEKQQAAEKVCARVCEGSTGAKVAICALTKAAFPRARHATRPPPPARAPARTPLTHLPLCEFFPAFCAHTGTR